MNAQAHEVQIGDRFARLRLIRRIGTRHKCPLWIVLCDCGSEAEVLSRHFRTGATRSCGCLQQESRSKRAADLSGQTFYMLTAIRPTDKRNSSKDVIWLCRCECGAHKQVSSANLKSGHVKTCGAHAKVLNGTRTHGMTDSDEYRIWCGIIQRCTNKSVTSWRNYGGRGISICDRWRNSFKAFFEDMGHRPSKSHSIDRIDNDKGYEPTNCRWGTPQEQATNKRFHRSQKLSIDDVQIIRSRFKAGETVKSIGADYPVTIWHLRRVISGTVWKQEGGLG